MKPGMFIAKPTPFNGDFGIFEDSLPDGYGRYLLHKALLREGINDSDLSALDRLSIVGSGGMGALTYAPISSIVTGETSENGMPQDNRRGGRQLRQTAQVQTQIDMILLCFS